MNSGILVIAGLLVTAEPTVASKGKEAEVVATPVIVTGEVTRFEPGKILVIKSDGREVTYMLTPDLAVPTEVQLGRQVTLNTERGMDGTTRVTRVVTTSVTPEGEVKRTTEETKVRPSGVVEKKTSTVTGEVVSLVPGKSIVIRRSGGADMTLALRDNVTLPADVQVGQRVTLFTEPGLDGNTTVSRVTTTSITPEGQAKRTVEETRTKPTGETTKTTTVTVQGKVQTYLPGKSITVLKSDGTPVTYMITEGAQLPVEIPAGKKVTIRTDPNGIVETIITEKN